MERRKESELVEQIDYYILLTYLQRSHVPLSLSFPHSLVPISLCLCLAWFMFCLLGLIMMEYTDRRECVCVRVPMCVCVYVCACVCFCMFYEESVWHEGETQGKCKWVEIDYEKQHKGKCPWTLVGLLNVSRALFACIVGLESVLPGAMLLNIL